MNRSRVHVVQINLVSSHGVYYATGKTITFTVIEVGTIQQTLR